MLKELDTYDWQEAFSNAVGSTVPCVRFGQECNTNTFTRDDVKTIEGIQEGENEGPNWILYGKLKDGRWFYLEAGCDYTGWDCQASGFATVAKRKRDLLQFGLTDDARERLGLVKEVEVESSKS